MRVYTLGFACWYLADHISLFSQCKGAVYIIRVNNVLFVINHV